MSGDGLARLVTLIALAACAATPARAAGDAEARAGGDLETGYGYDTNLFLDAAPVATPGQHALVQPSADSYFHLLARPRLSLRADDHALDADYALWFRQTVSHGMLLDHSGRLSYRTPRLGAFDLGVAGFVERESISYATERDESFWLAGGEASVNAVVGAATRLAIGYRLTWREYPDLPVANDGAAQRDVEHAALLGATLRPRAGLELGVQLAYAHNGSNDDRLSFDRGRLALAARWQVRPWLALGADYAVGFEYLPHGADDPLGASGRVRSGDRTDVRQSPGALIQITLARWLDVFVRYEGAFTWSTLDTLSYQRHVVLGGLKGSYTLAHRFRPRGGERAASVVGAATLPAGSREVLFRLHAPAARAVAVVGDFNEWDPARGGMRRDAGGTWRLAVDLVPGRHAYSFLVDGVPTKPADAESYVPDGWGGTNAVIHVP